MSKYDEVLKPFTAAMEKELHANSHKGDRPAWLNVSADTLMLELLYHHSKLQVALDAGNGDQILEYSADIANISMMIADVCGALSLAPAPAVSEREKLLEDQLSIFLDFVVEAPVGSGVCCCGGDMTDKSGQPVHHGDHTPVDQWNHSVLSWRDEINKLLGKQP